MYKCICCVSILCLNKKTFSDDTGSAVCWIWELEGALRGVGVEALCTCEGSARMLLAGWSVTDRPVPSALEASPAGGNYWLPWFFLVPVTVLSELLVFESLHPAPTLLAPHVGALSDAVRAPERMPSDLVCKSPVRSLGRCGLGTSSWISQIM